MAIALGSSAIASDAVFCSDMADSHAICESSGRHGSACFEGVPRVVTRLAPGGSQSPFWPLRVCFLASQGSGREVNHPDSTTGTGFLCGSRAVGSRRSRSRVKRPLPTISIDGWELFVSASPLVERPARVLVYKNQRGCAVPGQSARSTSTMPMP